MRQKDDKIKAAALQQPDWERKPSPDVLKSAQQEANKQGPSQRQPYHSQAHSQAHSQTHSHTHDQRASQPAATATAQPCPQRAYFTYASSWLNAQ
jgi:hypothetical protein